jgi:alkylation response protein AidB-like acyl-CoA dehydrogenase
MLADMAIKLEAARVLVYRAAANAENGIPSTFEASVAKTMANEAGIEITNAALQIHGAYGYTTDLPIERMLRDARGMAIGDGTVQIQRNLIANHLLKAGRSR